MEKWAKHNANNLRSDWRNPEWHNIKMQIEKSKKLQCFLKCNSVLTFVDTYTPVNLPSWFYSTCCISTWLLIELKYSLHFKQDCMRDIRLCQNNEELLICCNIAISRATEPSKYASDAYQKHPKNIVKDLHTHWCMCNEITVIFDIKSLLFFPEVNGNFSWVNFKSAKNLLHEKLNSIHNFKMETYYLLLMTSVKTEILCISPLITITRANTRQKKIAKVLVHFKSIRCWALLKSIHSFQQLVHVFTPPVLHLSGKYYTFFYMIFKTFYKAIE